MDFTNEINTLESEKLRLEEMLKRNNDRLQLLKEVSTKPSSDGYRRFFKLKGYSLLYTGGKCLNSDYFVFNCTLISTAGRDELLITKIKVNNGIIMFYVNSKKQWYYYEDLGESKWYADQLINYLDLTKFMHKDEGYK